MQNDTVLCSCSHNCILCIKQFPDPVVLLTGCALDGDPGLGNEFWIVHDLAVGPEELEQRREALGDETAIIDDQRLGHFT